MKGQLYLGTLLVFTAKLAEIGGHRPVNSRSHARRRENLC